MASVTLAVLSSVGLILLSFLLGRLLVVVGKRWPPAEAAKRYDRIVGVSTLLLWTGGFVSTVLFDPGAVVAEATAATAAGVVVNAALAAATGLGVKWALDTGLLPGMERIQPGELELARPFVRRARVAIVIPLFGLALLTMARETALASFSPAWLLPLSITTLVVFASLDRPVRVSPIGLPRGRDPTEAERTRIERCYERFDREPPGRIIISAGEATTSIAAAGTGSLRSAAVTETFLERADDEQLAVALATADERTRRYQYPLTDLHGLTVVFLVYFLLMGVVELLPWFEGIGLLTVFVGAVLSFLGTVVLAALATRNAYRADEFVAEQFGPETVGEVYRELGDSIWHDERDEDDPDLVATEPTLSDRLSRIGVDIPTDADDEDSQPEAPAPSTATAGVPETSDDPEQEHQSESVVDDSDQNTGDDRQDWSWPDPDYSNN